MISIVETGSGGDYEIDENGIKLDNSINTVGYIYQFGGNVEASTEIQRKPLGAKYKDFWGNADVLNEPQKQFNSEFERSLNNNSINSGNIVKFEGAAETDLDNFVQQGNAESVESEILITGPNELKINNTINQLSSTETETFSFMWSETLERVE